VADIVRHSAQLGADVSVVGFIDEDVATHGTRLDGVPVLGDWPWFDGADTASLGVICAVGSPRSCMRLAGRARDMGLSFEAVVSPLAHVSAGAHIGQGVILFPNTFVSTGARLGDHCVINVGASVSHDTTVGRCCIVGPGVRLAGNVAVGAGCYIGMGADVIQGCAVGEGAVIGAGAVVTRDLPPNVIAVGVPARVIKVRQ
jgi:sugar O-acyltransferase (sialic acid O-acetyltransferase NeuD family)